MDLKNKVAIITGASRGIGKAIALRLAQEGVHIVAAAKTVDPHPTLPGTILETVEECSALGPEALGVQMNVREEEEVKAGVEAAIEKFGRLDMAIHNAGALWWKPLEDTPVKKFDLVMDVNARGAYALAYYSFPHIKKSGGGHFLTLSPPVVLDALPGRTAYLISKFGMTMVAQGLAGEYAEHNIASNSLWPETGIETSATINFGLGTRELWYKPEIVADAAYEVLSKDPGARTGQAMLVLDVLKEAGVTDFVKYRCDPEVEPPIFDLAAYPRAGGDEKAIEA